VADAIFADRRLAEIYDPLDADRHDLDAYVALVEECDAHTVLDIGCGTGTYACMLANRGIEVVAVDPAEASLAVAHRKLGADRVRWLLGDATTVPPLQVDLATMTGNVAQVFLTDGEWQATLLAAHRALRPGGRLVFETRDPDRQAWREWNREQSYRRTDIAGSGVVESWGELTEVCGDLVTFRMTFAFHSNGEVITSDSTLRFRRRGEVAESLLQANFTVDEVRDAPDRPGREFVFIARRVADRGPTT
jgi:SAM-dependent methyltransferase